MALTHVISSKQFTKTYLSKLFKLANKIRSGKYNNKILATKIMATLFYEPSTRTRFSFESAMLRLGGSYISTENASDFSSAIKGETLEDTIRIVNLYSDIIVLRHPKSGASQLASKCSHIPIINAGDGNGEHPTQALLDLYTIFSKIIKPEFKITMAGDLSNYRSVHSLVYLLALYPKIQIVFVSPKPLSIPKIFRNYLKSKKVKFAEIENFKEGLSSDFIYITRIPKEYLSKFDYAKYSGKYILNKTMLKYINKDSHIMHPLPRVNEIPQAVDKDHRAIYFEQAKNGLYVRMALLITLFDKN